MRNLIVALLLVVASALQEMAKSSNTLLAAPFGMKTALS